MTFTAGSVLTASALNTFKPSTKIENANGTASDPTYTFDGDADTGIFRRSANQLGFAVEGTLAAYFDKVTDGGRFIGPGQATGTSIIRPNAGSASNPTYTFYGDEDTGLLRSAADEIGLATGGTQIVTISSDGRLGVGDTSPSATLHVNSGATNNVALFESTDAGAIIGLKDDSTTGNAYVGLRATGNNLLLRAGNSNHVEVESGGDVNIETGNLKFEGSGKTVTAANPTTGTGNDAEWAAPLGIYILQRNSSLAAEKENVTADLGEHLTADMIDSVVPKLWNRTHAPGYPEIGPIAEEMDAISPFLAARGTTADNVPFLTGINKTAYLSLLVLAVKDLRARVATLEA